MNTAPRTAVGRAIQLAAATLLLAACGDQNSSGPVDNRPRTVPVFQTHLTDLSHVIGIVPPGSVAGDEVKGHSYVRGDGTPLPVYAPVDMELKRGTWVGQSNDYGLEFEINRRFRLRLGHISDPRADIVAAIPRSNPNSLFDEITPIAFRAGDLIGMTDSPATTSSFDFGLYDMEREVQFPNVVRYRQLQDYTKLNSVCPYGYFTAALAGQYSALFESIGGDDAPGVPCRTFESVYGTSGGLAGEWFLDEGTPASPYGFRFAVGLSLTGITVRIAGLGGMLDVFGAADPRGITTPICYPDFGGNRFLFLRPTSATQLDVAVATGPCPESFPTSGSRRYAR